MKLKYWYAKHLTDSNCYSIRAKTKRDALKQLSEMSDPSHFGRVTKIEVEYRDAFHLLTLTMSECGGLYEEMVAPDEPGDEK